MEAESIKIGMHVKFWNGRGSFIGNIAEIRLLYHGNVFIDYSQYISSFSIQMVEFSIQMADGTTFEAVAEDIEREATPEEVFRYIIEGENIP